MHFKNIEYVQLKDWKVVSVYDNGKAVVISPRDKIADVLKEKFRVTEVKNIWKGQDVHIEYKDKEKFIKEIKEVLG